MKKIYWCFVAFLSLLVIALFLNDAYKVHDLETENCDDTGEVRHFNYGRGVSYSYRKYICHNIVWKQ